MTRGLYRSHWFEFLNAHLEDDARAAAAALTEIKKAGRAVGVRRHSDFSRTAVQEGRKAEALGKSDRAARAYLAAIELDDTNASAILARSRFLFRNRAYTEALRLWPDALVALLATRESRLATLSSLAVWAAAGLALAVLGSIVLLLIRHLPRFGHEIKEFAGRLSDFSAAPPLALVLLVLPLGLGLGPVWMILCWAALVFAYTSGAERTVLVAGLLLFGLLAPGLSLVARENMVERSPLYVAAVDLQERREDGSAEDGLRQASAVFAEDADVWFLLGIYAERAGDSERAIAAYEHAIQVSPNDYRPFLNRGNVHFQEGDYAEAIRDYDAASKRAPRAPEVYYNLAIARGEAYDFDGQTAAMAKARELSERDVAYWSDRPTLARVVAAPYPLSRARRKVEQWNAQPKSRRLPGHAPPVSLRILASPYTLLPWGILLAAVALSGYRASRSVASECVRCGKPFCRFCKRWGDPPLYCTDCVRSYIRKEAVGIEAQVAQSAEIRRRIRQKDLACRVTSILLPGTHHFFSQRPIFGFFVLASFCFFLAAAALGERLFDPRELPPISDTPVLTAMAAAGALIVWLVSVVGAWRESHGA